MSVSTDVLWVTESALDSVRRLVHGSISEWAQRWLPGEDLKQVKVATLRWSDLAPEPAADVSEPLLSAESVSRRWRLTLTRSLFGMAHEGSPVIDEVVDSATRALRFPMLSKLGQAALMPAPRPLPGHWGVRIDVKLLGFLWSACVSAESLRQRGILPMPRVAPVPTWDAQQVFADLPVELEAQVGDVQIGVQELVHLAEGDVIVLPQLTGAPINMRCSGSSLRLPGTLGTNTERTQRTLRLVAETPH